MSKKGRQNRLMDSDYLLGIIVLSALLWLTDSDYLLGIIVLSALLWLMDSDYLLGIIVLSALLTKQWYQGGNQNP
jgi:hypothetical protein